MSFHTQPFNFAIKEFHSNEYNGLNAETVKKNTMKYGINSLTKAKKQSFFNRLFEALKEPMLIILLFGFVLALSPVLRRRGGKICGADL